MKQIFVTGTDTGIGKTLVSVGLCLKFQAYYWKPIQSGEDKDTTWAGQFLKKEQVLPSSYELKEPLSPNQAAELENTKIDLNKIQVPKKRPLIIEGAGGLLVPLNKTYCVIDLIKKTKLPCLLVASSKLGTINHTLLSIEALKKRQIPLLGIVLCGPPSPKNKRDIELFGKASVIAEVPWLKTKNKSTLTESFSHLQLDKI